MYSNKPQKRTSYQVRLNEVRPGATIDKLKGEVTAYLKSNIEIRRQIANIDEFVVMKKSDVNELVEKCERAHFDRTELFRDCSTFEVVYSEHEQKKLYRQIKHMHEVIDETVKKVESH